MALRAVSRSREEAAALKARFGIAQDTLPEAEALQAQAAIRADIFELAKNIDNLVADGREKSLALTHLEEALMWAGKAIFKTEPSVSAETLPGFGSRDEGEVLP